MSNDGLALFSSTADPGSIYGKLVRKAEATASNRMMSCFFLGSAYDGFGPLGSIITANLADDLKFRLVQTFRGRPQHCLILRPDVGNCDPTLMTMSPARPPPLPSAGRCEIFRAFFSAVASGSCGAATSVLLCAARIVPDRSTAGSATARTRRPWRKSSTCWSLPREEIDLL